RQRPLLRADTRTTQACRRPAPPCSENLSAHSLAISLPALPFQFFADLLSRDALDLLQYPCNLFRLPRLSFKGQDGERQIGYGVRLEYHSERQLHAKDAAHV